MSLEEDALSARPRMTHDKLRLEAMANSVRFIDWMWPVLFPSDVH